MDIDPKFVDCDFRTFPQYVPGDLGRDDALCASMPSYEDFEAPIPSREWPELVKYIESQPMGGIEWLVTRIFNQGQEGSCVGNAATQMHQVQQAKQFGKENVIQLSAVSLYQQIGRSAQSGAYVPDSMTAVEKTGILPLDTPENRAKYGDCVMAHTGFRNPKPAGANAVMTKFRAKETMVVRTFEGLVSAGLRGKPVVVGRSGHSILYLRPTYQGSKINEIYVNSWTETQWGFPLAGFKGGFGLDTERLMRASAGWAFTIGDVVDYRL